MKKTMYSLLAVLLMVGCSKDDFKTGSDITGPDFTASFEDESSKVYVNGKLETRWTADDRISVFATTRNVQYKFNGKTGDDSGTFSEVETPSSTGSNIPTNYAVYPYSYGTSISSSGTISLSLPAVQSYASGTYGLGANTMVAATESSSSTSLRFKSLGGFLEVKLYGTGTVRSISIRGNNGEKIAGAATVTPVYGQDPCVSVSDSGTDEITIDCGKGVALGKTSKKATSFWFVIPPVTFSKGFTVTVMNTDGAAMVKSVSTSRTVQRNVKTSMTTLKAKFVSPEYVDLGLSVKWASFNFGAVSPQGYGKYYAWAETETKSDYSWSTYRYCNGSHTAMTKYCVNSSYGTIDNKTVLEPDDDVACVMWGGNWRMPTEAEWMELQDNCTWVWTTVEGVNGYKVSGKKEGYTDKSIFLPAAGRRNGTCLDNAGSYGYYCSSSLLSGNTCYVWDLYFGSDAVGKLYGYRCNGLSVRPVSE